MRQVLRRLGPRYGISLGLIVVIVIVVGLAHVFGSNGHDALVSGGGPGPSGAPASGPPDDGENSTPTPAAPSTSPGATPPRTVAQRFAAAWLHHNGVTAAEWHAAVSVYATASLSQELNGADPAGVPADRVAGDLTQINVGSAFVQFAVPTDTGTITLSLHGDQGRWLVSGIDWTSS